MPNLSAYVATKAGALVVAVALSAIALYVIGYEITFTVGARDTVVIRLED